MTALPPVVPTGNGIVRFLAERPEFAGVGKATARKLWQAFGPELYRVLGSGGGDGSRHSRCRFRVLQKPILGTADSEYWNRLGVRSVLLEIPEASMNKGVAG